MSQHNEHTDPKKDDRLADFTNQVLDGRTRQTASGADEELLSLEKTVLRLSDAFPPNPLTEADAKRMLVRFKARLRREEKTVQPSFWKRLFDFHANPQVGMILAAVVVVVLLVLGVPALQSGGSSLPGAASSNSGLWVALSLLGILLIVYWFSRRK
ncbi:MAG: hypothetical protein DPW18_03615 [Chloroflexi bacterium]|nr:hypothetical protein [Chloroflexota bacterium]MDL1941932.1 hypothetical protein [Chloroflexi bacterium CFX2]